MNICLIFNPKSGVSHLLHSYRPLESIIDFFTAQKIHLTIKPTMEPGDGIKLARECIDEGYTHVIACGGDGTINEVVNGIVGSNLVLGIIPYGTANVLASALGIPKDIKGACQHFINSNERRLDIAEANGRNYLTMSGIGFDAQVIEETEDLMKDTLGSFGFIIRGAQHFLSGEMEEMNTRFRIQLLDKDEEYEFQAWIVLVANVAHYSGSLKLALRAKPDDGLLDIVVFPFPSDGTLDFMSQLIKAMSESTLEKSDIAYFQSSNFEITSEPPVPCQIDGELIGDTPVRYSVNKKALKVKF